MEDILAQPAALRLTLASILEENRTAFKQAAEMIGSVSRLVLTSKGSAYYSLAPPVYALARLHPNVYLVETSESMSLPFVPLTLDVIMSRSGKARR